MEKIDPDTLSDFEAYEHRFNKNLKEEKHRIIVIWGCLISSPLAYGSFNYWYSETVRLIGTVGFALLVIIGASFFFLFITYIFSIKKIKQNKKIEEKALEKLKKSKLKWTTVPTKNHYYIEIEYKGEFRRLDYFSSA